MIYLDYSANTPADRTVLAAFLEAEQAYIGNPNSTHPAGRAAKAEMDGNPCPDCDVGILTGSENALHHFGPLYSVPPRGGADGGDGFRCVLTPPAPTGDQTGDARQNAGEGFSPSLLMVRSASLSKQKQIAPFYLSC